MASATDTMASPTMPAVEGSTSYKRQAAQTLR